MIRSHTDQTLPIEGLMQGNRYALVITGATSDVELQFTHAGDPTWRVMPDFDGALADVIRGDFFCFTSSMRLVFATTPGATYYMSCIPAVMSEY